MNGLLLIEGFALPLKRSTQEKNSPFSGPVARGGLHAAPLHALGLVHLPGGRRLGSQSLMGMWL